MALIKCPECGKEISETAKLCVNCGCPMKQKREFNKKLLVFVPVLILLFIAVALVVIISKKETYPELMQVLNCSSVSDTKEILGNDCEIKSTSTSIFYVYNNLELDGVVYETVHITENILDGKLYEIGFEFNTDNLEIIERYVKDISKSYGSYTKKDNSYISYTWVTAKTLNPQIYIHSKKDSYDINIRLG